MPFIGLSFKSKRPDKLSRMIHIWLGQSFVEIRVARHLPWDHFQPFLRVRSKFTQDGWLVYLDVRDIFHLRVQYHAGRGWRRGG